MNNYQKALEERKSQHLLRALPLPPEGIDFYSNDYLGLAQSADLHEAIEHACVQAPQTNGATGSRLLSGNSAYMEAVEQQIADFHRAEAALVYASGYTANLGLISCLATKDTTLVCDELMHASLIDGARLGQARKVRFNHNDPEDLEIKLGQIRGEKVVIVESVYSMDGDTCPLKVVVEVCRKHEALLVVDEAHSIGIYGEAGGGLVQQLGLETEVFARVVTYGKGPGIHGAAVVGPSWLKDYQVNFSRPLIFSTAPTNQHFASIAAMYQHLPQLAAERKNLQKVVAYFVQKRQAHAGDWLPSETHIQSLIIPGNEAVIELGNQLKAAGINALPIRIPSVPKSQERIRFCMHAYNTREEIDLLFETLKRMFPPFEGDRGRI